VSYVDSVLQPGETIRYRGDIHWKVYLPGLLLLVVAVLCIGAGLLAFVGILLLFPAFALLAWAWFQRFITEIAVTNRRIIYKSGFIQRHTIEMNMDKVESVDVSQSILGRILDYGDIVVRGTGATLEPFRGIGAPLDFRNHVTAG
jgi:uncharacterized membrane protein YdbT with pleckstrin-like domain